ncbi:DUF4129 domain-containing protein [Agromyces archimandritae]|uniref:DUF4129 domain-containing protein n=1 Tax=Agromyces archimandritae TaxID=2781962 RepID=A0A975FNQ3_9MICO|nr:DUF4129 domain-containing protein [Agromyces archimandritae]QTX05232.1 DUF4129 domain-containing protein [Agromyces archimandritae]
MRLALPFDPPLVPDPDEARRWLQDELAEPRYTAARPTLFDRAMQAILEWFGSLFQAGPAGPPPAVLALIAVIVIAGLAVVALLVFGRPRLRARRRAVALFGDDDTRSAAELRRAAERAFAAGDWDLAFLERFRAIVRALSDRELLRVHPGTTAHAAGEQAAAVFADRASELRDAAQRFDGVRYLGRDADREAAHRLAELDAELERRPDPARAEEPAEALR